MNPEPALYGTDPLTGERVLRIPPITDGQRVTPWWVVLCWLGVAAIVIVPPWRRALLTDLRELPRTLFGG